MSQDLMYSEEIHAIVREAYEDLEKPGSPGSRFYTERQLQALPAEAREWLLGVGNPTLHADLAEGETVVDLGCGAGVDVILAASEVGTEGEAIGVDFLPSMIERARRISSEAGVPNASFIQSPIEDVDLPDSSADTIISNGSINLSARKSRVLAEAHRVLRPGGRICVSDLTLPEDDLPPEILTHPSAWAG